jgi:hypothetical protein
MVNMQLPKAVATKSVGENRAPFPLLSTGASVSMIVPDFKWVAEVLKSPLYATLDIIIDFFS